MEYDKKLRPESLKRNGYHLFVDLLDRIIHESTTQAMRSACRALWCYMTSYWLKLTIEKIDELNQRLVGLLGRRGEPSEVLPSVSRRARSPRRH